MRWFPVAFLADVVVFFSRAVKDSNSNPCVMSRHAEPMLWAPLWGDSQFLGGEDRIFLLLIS